MNVDAQQIQDHIDEGLDGHDIWHLAYYPIDMPRKQAETVNGIAIE